jgi:hypothetical protein
MHAGQLTAEAVATDDPGQGAGLIIRRDKDRLAGGQILFSTSR